MAFLKKNQLNNVLVPMVDKTDFATIESTLDAVDIDIKLYGVAQGGSTLASTITVSKAARLVRSGIFQITLKATETDAHDHYMLRLSSTSTVSCAIQLVPLEMVDNDDSDIYSAISDLRSTMDSQFAVVSNYLSNASNFLSSISVIASDAHSAAILGASHASLYGKGNSDILSQVLADVTGLAGADASDIASATWVHAVGTRVDSRILLIQSDAQYASNLLSNISGVISDIDSRLTAMGGPEHIASLVWDADKGSYVGASTMGSVLQAVGGTALTVSDISDIASRVWSEKWRVHSLASSFGSAFSNVWTAASQGASRALLNQSLISDVDSQVLLNASMISDAMSAAQQANSRVLVVQSMVSDVDSQLLLNASMISDVLSRVPDTLTSVVTRISQIDSGIDALQTSVTVGASGLSNIGSAVWAQHYAAHSLASSFGSMLSAVVNIDATTQNNNTLLSQVDSQLLLNASMISDATSAAQQANSRVLVVQSLVSDVDSQLLLNASTISDVLSMLTAMGGPEHIASLVWDADKGSYVGASTMGSVLQATGATPSAVASAVWQEVYSNYTTASTFGSKVATLTGGGVLTVSDISDIASRVWGEAFGAHSLAGSFGSLVSVIGTNAAAGSSRALVVQSRVSDVESQLDVTHSMVSDIDSALTSQYNALSNMISDAHSDLRSQMSGLTTGVSVSDISNIASRVWSEKWSDHSLASSFGSAFSNLWTAANQGASRALVTQSMISDVDSQLTVTHSLLSDVDSALTSQYNALSGQISDIESQLDITHSLVSDIESQLDVTDTVADNIYSLLSDINSDFESRVASGVGGMVVESQGSITLQQAMDVILAAVAGVTDTSGVVFRSPDGVAVRITATTNANNERTSIVLTPSS